MLLLMIDRRMWILTCASLHYLCALTTPLLTRRRRSGPPAVLPLMPPRTNNRVHNVTSSTDKCSPYLPPNTSSQPPVPVVPTSSSMPDLRVTLSDTMIPRRSPTPPIERAPFDVAVVLLLSHSTIVAAVAALSDAPDAVARNLAHIAADVADVLRVTDAIMQIALCITQRIANDRSLVPGSRARVQIFNKPWQDA